MKRKKLYVPVILLGLISLGASIFLRDPEADHSEIARIVVSILLLVGGFYMAYQDFRRSSLE